jgi:predicted PilT family ATPase
MKLIKIWVFLFLVLVSFTFVFAQGPMMQNQNNSNGIGEMVREQIREGYYTIGNGTMVRIMAQENNKLRIRTGEQEAETDLEIYEDGTTFKTNLSNGKYANIKIMPDVASEKALERLRVRACNESLGCQIELKEVGSGNKTKAAYEVRAEKRAKVLGLFKTKMQVQAQINAENGEVISTKKPWWAFLATESEE